MVEGMFLMVNARSFYFVFHRPVDFTRVYHQLYKIEFNTVAVPGHDRKSKKTAGPKFPNKAGSQPVSASPNICCTRWNWRRIRDRTSVN